MYAVANPSDLVYENPTISADLFLATDKNIYGSIANNACINASNCSILAIGVPVCALGGKREK
jgi:hypothetical protein